jgi:hypothetical protein
VHDDLEHGRGERLGEGPTGVVRGDTRVGFDHATHGPAEHMLLLDFMNRDLGPAARVGVELDLASGRALLAELQAVIDAADATGLS